MTALAALGVGWSEEGVALLVLLAVTAFAASGAGFGLDGAVARDVGRGGSVTLGADRAWGGGPWEARLGVEGEVAHRDELRPFPQGVWGLDDSASAWRSDVAVLSTLGVRVGPQRLRFGGDLAAGPAWRTGWIDPCQPIEVCEMWVLQPPPRRSLGLRADGGFELDFGDAVVGVDVGRSTVGHPHTFAALSLRFPLG